MKIIKSVVFDLGRVVVKLDEEYVPISVKMASTSELESLKSALRDDFSLERRQRSELSVNELYQIGELSDEQYSTTISALINKKVSPATILADMNSFLVGEIASTVGVVESLVGRYKLACLSNTCAVHWSHMLQTYPVMRHFDLHGVSHLLRSAKPFPEIYQKMSQELDTEPSAILLIDDREKNIEGAKLVGWRTLHLKSPESLVGELKKFYPELLAGNELRQDR